MHCDTLEINKGEGVYAELLWDDEGGPINLTGRTLSIVEAHPAGLVDGRIEVVDPLAGKGWLIIDPPVSHLLRPGRTNWVRVGLLLSNGRWDTSPKIWIDVV